MRRPGRIVTRARGTPWRISDETDLVDGRGTGALVRMRVEQVRHEDERLGKDADRGAGCPLLLERNRSGAERTLEKVESEAGETGAGSLKSFDIKRSASNIRVGAPVGLFLDPRAYPVQWQLCPAACVAALQDQLH